MSVPCGSYSLSLRNSEARGGGRVLRRPGPCRKRAANPRAGSPGAVRHRHAGHGVLHRGLTHVQHLEARWTQGGRAAVQQINTWTTSDTATTSSATVSIRSMLSAEALLGEEAKPDQFTWALTTSRPSCRVQPTTARGEPICVGLPQGLPSFTEYITNPRRGGIRREKLRVKCHKRPASSAHSVQSTIGWQQRVRLALRGDSELYTTTMDRG